MAQSAQRISSVIMPSSTSMETVEEAAAAFAVDFLPAWRGVLAAIIVDLSLRVGCGEARRQSPAGVDLQQSPARHPGASALFEFQVNFRSTRQV
jgi:hypothetical protein